MMNSMKSIRLVQLSRFIISLTFLFTAVHSSTDLNNRECSKNVHGRDYAGTKNLTKDGKPCLKWENFGAYNNKDKFPHDGSSQHNYCRIPKDDTTATPWCHTTTTRKEGSSDHWGKCNIPNCSEPICREGIKSNESCVCHNGYELSSKLSCTDIDECSITNKPNTGCDECNNTKGSYKCISCINGYHLSNNKCTNIDECTTQKGVCEQNCTNTPGSFRCECRSGYKLNDDQRNCSDINECLISNGRCVQECLNSPGNYECTCNDGYQTDQQNKSNCDDINECSTNNGGCEDSCTNTNGSYHCSCRDGFSASINKNTCDDIDECETKRNGCQQNCINTIGSYTCSCYDEYVTDINDPRLCVQNPILQRYIRREVFFGCLSTLLVLCISLSMGWLIHILYKKRREHDAAQRYQSSATANNPRKTKNVGEAINLQLSLKDVTGADYEALAEHKKPRVEETVYQQLENNMYDEVHK